MIALALALAGAAMIHTSVSPLPRADLAGPGRVAPSPRLRRKARRLATWGIIPGLAVGGTALKIRSERLDDVAMRHFFVGEWGHGTVVRSGPRDAARSEPRESPSSARPSSLVARPARSAGPSRVRIGRVEEWRGGLGSAYLFPALSSAGASIASPCSVSTPRSSNRTGGFPASGSRTRTHAFAHGKLRVRPLRRTSPSTSCRYSSGNRDHPPALHLVLGAQPLAEPVAAVPVDGTVRRAHRAEAEVVRPAQQLPVQSSHPLLDLRPAGQRRSVNSRISSRRGARPSSPTGASRCRTVPSAASRHRPIV